MTILIVICVLSFAVIVFLSGRQIYFVKDLSMEELETSIESGRPFFDDFEKRLAPLFPSLFNKTCLFFCSRKEFGFLRKHFRRFSDYMNGRHTVERNGCKGYWHEVNGSKNNGSGDNVNENMPR